jgi:hypothetical protein
LKPLAIERKEHNGTNPTVLGILRTATDKDSGKVGKKRLASRDAIAMGGGITLIIPNIKKSNGI